MVKSGVWLMVPNFYRENVLTAILFPVGCRCQFQCSLCSLIVHDRRIIKSHVATHHSMKYNDYVDTYGDPEIPTDKVRHAHSCKPY